MQISPNLVCPQLISRLSNIFKFYAEHGSDTAVLFVNFQNELTTEMDDLDK